nr:hypothetical protein [Tanacetum cinerariifolium]
MGQTNQTVHMIMPSKDKMYNGQKGIGSENPSYFCKAKDLRPTLYDERVINLGYTLMFLTHFDEWKLKSLKEQEKIKLSLYMTIAFDCNNDRNALCNARMNASVDVNDLFVLDDVSIRKS